MFAQTHPHPGVAFFTRSYLISATDAEVEAADRRDLPRKRLDEIDAATQTAFQRFCYVLPEGCC